MAKQVSNNGWANINFRETMKRGGIGALIGGGTGAFSYSLGYIGSFYGQMIGGALGNMSIAGLNVGKAFSYIGGASLFSMLGIGVGYLLGSFTGSTLGNELISNLFGYNPSSQENVSEGIIGLIMNGIMTLLEKLFGG